MQSPATLPPASGHDGCTDVDDGFDVPLVTELNLLLKSSPKIWCHFMDPDALRILSLRAFSFVRLVKVEVGCQCFRAPSVVNVSKQGILMRLLVHDTPMCGAEAAHMLPY